MKIDFNSKTNLKSYAQVVADIAMIAQDMINRYGYYDYDSINLNGEIADWALDFEEAWQTLGMNEDYSVDYIEMIDSYASKKLEAFFEGIPHDKPIPKTEIENVNEHDVWMRLGIRLHTNEAQARMLLAQCGIGKTIIRQLVNDGEFELDGETYVPANIVEDYNDEHNTWFDIDNIVFNF